MWNASRFCVSSLRRGHANLLCIVPILVYVAPKRLQRRASKQGIIYYKLNSRNLSYCHRQKRFVISKLFMIEDRNKNILTMDKNVFSGYSIHSKLLVYYNSLI